MPGEKLELQPAIRRSTAESAGRVKFPLRFLARPNEGGFTVHLTALACLPWRPAKLRWLHCWVPIYQTGMRLSYCKRPTNGLVFFCAEVQWVWVFFLDAIFYVKTVSFSSHTRKKKKSYFCYAFTFFPFPLTLPFMFASTFLYIRLHHTLWT